MFSFLTPYLTYIKIAIVAAALLAMGTLYAMVSHYKSINKELTAQIALCRDANKEDLATIAILKQEGEKASVECVTRLGIKDDTIKKMQKLLNLKGEATNEKPGAVGSSGDDVLDTLNGLYPKAGSQGGICSGTSGGAVGPGAGSGSRVLLRRYCFGSKQDILNFLSNQAMHDAREKDLESILLSHQTYTK
jgi:hypothetical protein